MACDHSRRVVAGMVHRVPVLGRGHGDHLALDGLDGQGKKPRSGVDSEHCLTINHEHGSKATEAGAADWRRRCRPFGTASESGILDPRPGSGAV